MYFRLMLSVHVNNFSVNNEMFHGLNQYQGHNTMPPVRLEPVTAEVEHSTSTPLSSSTVCFQCAFSKAKGLIRLKMVP